MSYLEKYNTEVESFIAVCQYLAKEKYVTSHGGNLAWKLEDDVILITPTKVNKGSVCKENVVFINMKGETIEGTVKPTGETPMYVKFFSDRPDVRTVLHCHPPLVNAFAITTGKNYLMRPILPETTTEIGPVPIVPYGEPLTQQLADNFEPFLQRYNAFIMESHGLVIMSAENDMDWLKMNVDILEMTAKHIIAAKSLGADIKEISKQDVANMNNIIKTRGLPLFGAPGQWENLEDMYFNNPDQE